MKNSFKIEFKKRIYIWTLKLIRFIDGLNSGYTTQIIGKQLLRSGTSVLANYVEADSASSNKEFANFFGYSLKSANESKVWLSLLKDSKKADGEKVDRLLEELIEISKVVATSIITVRKRIKK